MQKHQAPTSLQRTDICIYNIYVYISRYRAQTDTLTRASTIPELKYGILEFEHNLHKTGLFCIPAQSGL